MNLQRVKYFVAVAEELHFGRAADRLHMAQPPLSQQIRLLEAELDVKLFERTTRRVSLTAAGEAFHTEARLLSMAADAAERAMEEFRTGDGGLLRLGFVDSAAFEVMPTYLRSYRNRWPKVQHDLRIMSSSEQTDALANGTIDLGISRTALPSSSYHSLRFRNEALYLAVGPDQSCSDAATVSVAELGGEPLIGFDRRLSPSLHAQLKELFESAEQNYEPVIEATEYTTILGLVSSGEGIAIVPDGVRTFQPAGVTYVKLSDPNAEMAMYVNSRTDNRLKVVAQARDLIARIFVDK